MYLNQPIGFLYMYMYPLHFVGPLGPGGYWSGGGGGQECHLSGHHRIQHHQVYNRSVPEHPPSVWWVPSLLPRLSQAPQRGSIQTHWGQADSKHGEFLAEMINFCCDHLKKKIFYQSLKGWVCSYLRSCQLIHVYEMYVYGTSIIHPR